MLAFLHDILIAKLWAIDELVFPAAYQSVVNETAEIIERAVARFRKFCLA